MTKVYRPGQDCQIPGLDSIYAELFGELHNGTFIEIGAFDGQSVSNTCFLADIGWRGFYFEPVQEYALRCQLRHLKNDVRVISSAVGNRTCFVDISVGMMISTVRMDHVEIFNKLSWSSNHHRGDIRSVPCISIFEALEKLSLQTCDLAIIDVEGFEPTIVCSWDFNILKPKVFIIETRDGDPEFPISIQNEYKEMMLILVSNGYKEFFRSGCNVIFVHETLNLSIRNELTIF